MKDISLPKFEFPSKGEIDIAKEEIFSGSGMYIFKSVIKKLDALKIQNFLLMHNSNIFKKVSSKGNHRLFFYPESPYWHPPFIEFLWEKICNVRNSVYEDQEWFENYKERHGLRGQSLSDVLNFQRKHSWASFFWYKNADTHFRHIDGPGELACFLVLSEKGQDYKEGGLYLYKDENDQEGVLADDNYNFGDLVVFDQSRVWHEVKNLVIDDRLGRFQFYVPNIPDGRINDFFAFEGSKKVYFSKKTNLFKKIHIQLNHLFNKSETHYSRKSVKYNEKVPPKF